MTAAQPPTWPTGRTLAGWWPHLNRFRPRCLWLSHLLLHRVEAPVGVCRPLALDGVTRLLLEAVAGSRQLSTLHLDAQILGRLLAELSAAGLARSNDASSAAAAARGERPSALPSGPPPGEQTGGAGYPASSALPPSPPGLPREGGRAGAAAAAGAWTVTEAGRQALAGRHEPVVRERRTFYFAEGPPAHPGVRFLSLDRPPAAPWPEAADWRFDVELLRACVAQPAEWKQRHGFPADVCAAPNESVEAWQQVIIDRPEQSLLLFVLVGEREEQESLLGLAVQIPGWELQTDRPVLALGGGWREALPELAEDPGLERWREAWRGWCQPRGLPVGEVEACILERRGIALVVQAPRPLAERLRAGRSEILKGEAWLLAGDERTRCAAVVELGEL